MAVAFPRLQMTSRVIATLPTSRDPGFNLTPLRSDRLAGGAASRTRPYTAGEPSHTIRPTVSHWSTDVLPP